MADDRGVNGPLQRAIPLVAAALTAAALALVDAGLAGTALRHAPSDGGALVAGCLLRWLPLSLLAALPAAFGGRRGGALSASLAAVAGVLACAAVGALVHGPGDARVMAGGAGLAGVVAGCVAAGAAVTAAAGWLPGRLPAPALLAVGIVALGWTWARGPLASAAGALADDAWSPTAAAADEGAPDVILVTLDTWRADALSAADAPLLAGITPVLDELAGGGLMFEQAVAPAPLTGPCHSTLLAGVPPWDSGVLTNGQPVPADLPWLPSQLRAAGYRTAAFVSSAMLDGDLGFARGFGVYDDDLVGDAATRRSLWGFVDRPRGRRELRSERFERPGAETLAAASRWLDAGDPSVPIFVWLHLYEAHAPYEPAAEVLADLPAGEPALPDPAAYADHPAQGVSRPDPTAQALDLLGLRPRRWPGSPEGERPPPPTLEARTLDPAAVLRSSRAYLGEVRTADQLTAAFAERVADRRGGRPAVWLVAGDHGESLSEHNELRSHKQHVYEANVRVPLILAADGVDGGRLAGPVSTAGVAGTLADLAGVDASPFPCLPAPAACDGGRPPVPAASIVRGPDHTDSPRRLIKVAVREGDTKLVRAHPVRRSPWSEWYTLAADPHEITPLDPDTLDPALVTSLTATADSLLDLAATRRTGGAIPDEMREALKALGYVE